MMKNFKQLAQNVIEIEQQAIAELSAFIDDDFAKACELMFNCSGRVIVIGMGKSGHIGGKIAATLASTGTPSFFVHPGEASHGDLGMITLDDVVMTISNSGETGEVLAIIPVIKRIGAKLIAMTGNADSTLAKLADRHICVKVSQEACPLGLAPTSSTTATLVMGDALAIALLQAKGFTKDDFALSHPGGSLGRKLLLKVSDIMHAGQEIPVVDENISITNALYEISNKGLGMTAVTNQLGQLTGLFTDGDLRRVIDADINLRQTKIAEVMTKNCVTLNTDMLAASALKIMDEKNINGLIVVNAQNQPIGALNMLDMVRAGVI